VQTRVRLLSLAAALLIGSAAASAVAAQGTAPRTDRAADSAAAAIAHRSGAAGLRDARYEEAIGDYTRAIELRARLLDSAGLASSLNSRGAAHYQLGQYELALESLLRSLAIRRALADSVGIARVLSNIGKSYQDQHLFDRALPALQEAVTIAEVAGDSLVLGYALNTLGGLMSEVGDHAAARALLARAVEAYRSGTPPPPPADASGEPAAGWAFNLTSYARVHVRAGDPQLAIPLVDSVIEYATRVGSVRAESQARVVRGQAYGAMGRSALAIAELSRALELARSAQQRLIMLEALQELAALEESAGRAAVALGHERASQALRDTIFDRAAAQRIAALEARLQTERLLEERSVREALITRQRVVVGLAALVLALATVLVAVLVRDGRRARERQAELSKANHDLRAALAEVRTLSGFIPICAHCKNVRDDRGFWEGVETYVADRSHAMFSHSICPSCGPEIYGDDWDAVQKDVR
jgi:tetratricopeptide (TPR) repeat protein